MVDKFKRILRVDSDEDTEDLHNKYKVFCYESFIAKKRQYEIYLFKFNSSMYLFFCKYIGNVQLNFLWLIFYQVTFLFIGDSKGSRGEIENVWEAVEYKGRKNMSLGETPNDTDIQLNFFCQINCFLPLV